MHLKRGHFFSRSRVIRRPTRRFGISIWGWKTIGHSPKTIGRNFKKTFWYKRCTTRKPTFIWLPQTAVPVLNLHYQSMKIHPVAGGGRSGIKLVLANRETAHNQSLESDRPLTKIQCTRPTQFRPYFFLHMVVRAREDGRQSVRLSLPNVAQGKSVAPPYHETGGTPDGFAVQGRGSRTERASC